MPFKQMERCNAHTVCTLFPLPTPSASAITLKSIHV